MSFEQKINAKLNKYPNIKKKIKRSYQLAAYAVSPKVKSEGNIVRISPNDNMEYFFGYYDKSPWDISGQYMLCLRAENTWSDVAPKEPADILLIDTSDNNSFRVLAKTNCWNVQQGCMLQWLGPDFSSEIIYNDFRENKYCSVILNIRTNEERVLPCPVYSVAKDGINALTLDFSRLHRLRKGYGYSNIEDETQDEKLPDRPCIWHLDIKNGEVNQVLKYTDFANFESRHEMKDAEHKVNHIMISPSGKRFMVLHRWFKGTRKYSRLVTCNIDGSDMYNLSDDDMVSHYCWKNEQEILAFENKHNSGPGYYLMKDKTGEYTHLWPQISNDGHPSYSPDKSLIVTDSYPDRSRVSEIKLLKDNDIGENEERIIAKVFAPFKYDNDTRCDLHPRWNHEGSKVCFDGVFEGNRGIYVIVINE